MNACTPRPHTFRKRRRRSPKGRQTFWVRNRSVEKRMPFSPRREIRRRWIESYPEQSVIRLSRAQENAMNQNEPLTAWGHPTPELPVADVELAQRHYCDALGFEVGWLEPGKEIGSVSRDGVA